MGKGGSGLLGSSFGVFFGKLAHQVAVSTGAEKSRVAVLFHEDENSVLSLIKAGRCRKFDVGLGNVSSIVVNVDLKGRIK